MESTFESQLREATTRLSEQLVQEVVQIIFQRLGIGARLDLKPAAIPASGGGAAPGKKSVSKPSKVAVPKPITPRSERDRPLDARRQRLLTVVTSSRGLSLGELQRSTGFPRTFVRRALKELRSAGHVYMAGDRGLARYAGSLAVAQQAHVAARLAQRKDGGKSSE